MYRVSIWPVFIIQLFIREIQFDLKDRRPRSCSSYHDVIVQMQRAIHLAGCDQHDDRMHQVGAVSQPR